MVPNHDIDWSSVIGELSKPADTDAQIDVCIADQTVRIECRATANQLCMTAYLYPDADRDTLPEHTDKTTLQIIGKDWDTPTAHLASTPGWYRTRFAEFIGDVAQEIARAKLIEK